MRLFYHAILAFYHFHNSGVISGMVIFCGAAAEDDKAPTNCVHHVYSVSGLRSIEDLKKMLSENVPFTDYMTDVANYEIVFQMYGECKRNRLTDINFDELWSLRLDQEVIYVLPC